MINKSQCSIYSFQQAFILRQHLDGKATYIPKKQYGTFNGYGKRIRIGYVLQ